MCHSQPQEILIENEKGWYRLGAIYELLEQKIRKTFDIINTVPGKYSCHHSMLDVSLDLSTVEEENTGGVEQGFIYQVACVLGPKE